MRRETKKKPGGPRLRALKYLVQPIWVMDDGTTLAELPGETFAVLPEAWDTFAREGIAQARTRACAQLGIADDVTP